MLSEKTQSQNVAYCMISFIYYSWNVQIIEMGKISGF